MPQIVLNSTAAIAVLGASSSFGVSTFSEFNRIYIYSGAMPSVTDYKTNYTTYDSQNLLVNFISGDAATMLSVQDYKLRWIAGQFSTPVAATASGTASWFAVSTSVNRSDTTSTSTWFILGTVGDSSSSADLKIPSVNIVSGEFYTCSGFSFSYPLIHEV